MKAPDIDTEEKRHGLISWASEGKQPAGFSLVEVTLALGVFAFSLVAILGLLPAGLGTADSVFRQGDVRSIMSSASTALRNVEWDGGDLVTGEWLASGGASLPVSGRFIVREDGSIHGPGGSPAAYNLDIETAGAISWPGILRATLTVSWPAGDVHPVGSRKTVIHVRVPDQQ